MLAQYRKVVYVTTNYLERLEERPHRRPDGHLIDAQTIHRNNLLPVRTPNQFSYTVSGRCDKVDKKPKIPQLTSS